MRWKKPFERILGLFDGDAMRAPLGQSEIELARQRRDDL